MIPDEIIRRRYPPAYGYRIPNSQFVNEQDPLSHDLEGYMSDSNSSEILGSHDTIRAESPPRQDEEITSRNKVSPKLFPSSYGQRISINPTTIALDIRKYLASNHVNPF